MKDEKNGKRGGSIWREPHGGLWHTTHPERFGRILESGAILAQGGQICDQELVDVLDLLGDLVRQFAVGRANFRSRVRRTFDTFIQCLDYHLLYGMGDLVALGPRWGGRRECQRFLGSLSGRGY